MNRFVTVTVIIFILCASSLGFAVYEYTFNEQIVKENSSLKQQLNDTALERARLEGELNETRARLNETQTQIQQLQQQVANQTAQIEKLRNQLKMKTYTTIGLSFMWNPSVAVDVPSLYAIVQRMDDVIWDPLRIYFFVYAAQKEDFMPRVVPCGYGGGVVDFDQSLLYPPPHIAVDVVESITEGNAGAASGCTFASSNRYLVAITVGHGVVYESQVLTAEMLHVFGFSDQQEQQANEWYSDIIPISWIPQIQEHAKWFQIPVPLSAD
jgi:ElaB/YqjD/DUF883 family membrane-anchored ribosome-binding protein